MRRFGLVLGSFQTISVMLCFTDDGPKRVSHHKDVPAKEYHRDAPEFQAELPASLLRSATPGQRQDEQFPQPHHRHGTGQPAPGATTTTQHAGLTRDKREIDRKRILVLKWNLSCVLKYALRNVPEYIKT